MGVGMMGALEIVADKKTKAAFDLATVGAGDRSTTRPRSAACSSATWATAIAICPPLIINEAELADLFGRLRQAFDAALAELKSEGHFKG